MAMTGRMRTAMLAVATTAAVLAAAAPASTPVTQTKTTRSYVFVLELGPNEKMWTQAQVRAQHPRNGEVMLGGTMSHSMSMGGLSRHLEVKIKLRATGKVVAGANPTIVLVDQDTMGGMSMKVPVAIMRGVDEGTGDVHYGNNVDLDAGHVYKVTVTLKGQRAVFQVKAPKS
jgi:hypothetical protein